MRNISFAKTTEQVRLRRKTVTRRQGWLFLKHGDLLQPVVKGQGIPKGGRVEKIGGPIRVVSVRRQPLSLLLSEVGAGYARNEITKEGFPGMDPGEFLHKYFEGARSWWVTRIEFEYTADCFSVKHSRMGEA